MFGFGRFELYEITYDEELRPVHHPVGVPFNNLDAAQAEARKLQKQGRLWEIVETMRRLVDSYDRVPPAGAGRIGIKMVMND